VRNQIVEISAPEMQFTEQEVERFFTDIIPVNLTAREVHEIGKHMEGWVGGLQLLGLSLKEKEGPEELGDVLGKSRRQAWEYLMHEVISVQSHKVRTFLEGTAPLDRFNVEVAREITGLPDAGEILETVYRQNLFLIPLDGARRWHRYHHLLSEAVRERMKASSPDRLGALHRQAALWFARNGYLEDAFQNAFASEDYEFAADLMEDYMLQINDRYEYASGSRWLAKLPDRVFRSRVLIRLHDCGQKIETFRLADIEAVLRDIEKDPGHAFDRYTGRKRTYCEDVSTYFSYVLRYYYKDPGHPVPEQLEKAFRMISSENGLFAGYLKTIIAWSYISLGNPPKAEAALEEALPLIISSGKLWARVLWFRLSATVQRIQGRLRTSEAILREGFEFLEQRKLAGTPLRYVLYVPLAWVHFQRNEIENASRYAAAATSYGEHVGFLRDIAEGNLLLSLTNMAAGKVKESEDCLRKIRLATERHGVPETGFSVEPWFVHLSMADGDLRYATEWLERRGPSPDDAFSSNLVRESMAQVELLIRQRHYRKAESVLMRLRHLCVDRRMMEAVLDIDVARSAALFADKHRERATQVMEDALTFAETEGYIRPFLTYAPMIFPLLSDMKAADLGLRQFLHLKAVMAACVVDSKGLVSSTVRFRKDRSKGLTEREIEILRLMAAGYRYQEIARRMFISFETVKTHVKHVFRKLEVKSKTQAVRRAQDLGLLGE
jgi:LuxR family maltose regulon positive regulatory protein